MLMPEIYAKHHTELLKSRKGSLVVQGGEFLIICQHRSKYIFPAYLKVLRSASMLNAFTYVATIMEKSPFTNSKRAYVLLNAQFKIIGLSSSMDSIMML